ncbi:MBOAT family protein [Luteolibacter luteus]|uniref:Membrane bound O-acyl transferase family-domain-containing protein n=1 Tax=Luteolibacter luteus TaxID=2728835 RepID=A0A858RGX6_9BACT|nr:MBOAT family protein [Luteolibacter luteus]QJE95831.1 membrane bound O-acyl transferase family-domain-containing protein [Luteolibacter luteus]
METVTWLGQEIPRWVFMWSIAVVMFAMLKGLSLIWARNLTPRPGRKLAYLFLWPGMDAAGFINGSPDRLPDRSEWAMAALKTLLAVGLIAAAPQAEQAMLRAWIGMIGIVLFFHFGTFHLLSCFWRSLGMKAAPLMDHPLAATSASAFWGRHWNIAFRDLTHRMVFKPALKRWGAPAALMAGFVFSGVLHELAVTIPAGGWYGGPTLFFVIQGLAALAERTRRGKTIGLGQGVRGWLFTQGLLLLTVPLLFPPPFALRIINPFIDFIHELF